MKSGESSPVSLSGICNHVPTYVNVCNRVAFVRRDPNCSKLSVSLDPSTRRNTVVEQNSCVLQFPHPHLTPEAFLEKGVTGGI